MFLALFNKNFIFWKRKWVASMIEALLPIAILLIVGVLRSSVQVTHKEEQSYLPRSIPLPLDVNAFSKDTVLLFKNCSSANRRGGRVVLSPRNEMTETLSQIFDYLNYTTVIMPSSSQVDSYTQLAEYTEPFANGTWRQFCFGIDFHGNTTDRSYSYSLRFNNSHIMTQDHYKLDLPEKIPLRFDSDYEFANMAYQGVTAVKILIDSLIFNREAKVRMQMNVQRMRSKSFDYADFSSIEMPLTLSFIIAGLIPFLRIISIVVDEREKKIVENMENIGMIKTTYFISTLLFMQVVQLGVGILFASAAKLFVLRRVSFLLIFFAYVVLVNTLICLGMLISSFFSSTKRAIITAIVVYVALMAAWILKESVHNGTKSRALALAQSPLGNISLFVRNFVTFESLFRTYGFGDLDISVEGFKGKYYFTILGIQTLVLQLLAIYFYLILRRGSGSALHPLFFLGFTNSEKREIETGVAGSEQKNNEMFEAVPQELASQSAMGRTLRVENVVKRFEEKLAVNGLTLEMYSGQIFVLLGHNGAGKTTLISMVSGLYPQTSGDISIYGHDSLSGREEIKRIMGICPQKNPIVPYLTVEEHLRLYSQIKGGSNTEAEITQLMQDIDLYHKRGSLTSQLSGGQKRKLCIALSFVGDSRVILLDEPTSGMDTYARRFMWDMLKKYKKDRIIILTTHNMDEAEYLGDRIGIMANGNLITVGSSLFLKRRFDVGYVLTLVRSATLPGQADRVLALLARHVRNPALLSEAGKEIRVQLPLDQAPKFQPMFRHLEAEMSSLGLSDFGVSITTLEDVFLQSGAHQNDLPIDRLLAPPPSKTSEPLPPLEDLRVAQSALFSQQMKGLLVKKLIETRRDIGGLINEILIPILIMAVGFSLIGFKLLREQAGAPLSMSLFSSQSFAINKFSFRVNETLLNTQTFLARLPGSNVTARQIPTNSSSEFDREIFDKNATDQFYAYFVHSANSSVVNFTTFVNATAPLASLVALHAANNALYSLLLGPGHRIDTFLSPFANTSGMKKVEDTLDGLIIGLFLAVAYTFIPSSLIVNIIQERECKSKRLKIISGVSLFGYWLSHFLIDLLKYLLVATITYVLFFIYRVDFLTRGNHWLMSLLLLLSFGFTMILGVYCFSFAFSRPFNGQIFTFLICFVSSYFLPVIVQGMRTVEPTRHFAHNILQNIFRVIPHFSFSNGFMIMANIDLFRVLYGWTRINGAFDRRTSLPDLISIILATPIFLALLIFLERREVFGRPKAARPDVPVTDGKGLAMEDVSVDSYGLNSDPIIAMKDVRKTYRQSLGWGTFKIVQAVKGVSMGIARGEVLGLLGTNGAGKSSTFKMLTGEIQPSSGEVSVMGHPLPEEISSVRHLIGYCPQFDALCDRLTAREHLELYCQLKGIDSIFHKEIIDDLMEKLNLEMNRSNLAGNFSEGNKRKLSVAIALLGGPPIVFLDEPSSGMDPQSRRFMWNAVSDLTVKKGHSTVVITTHSMEEAEALTTKIAILVEGRLKTFGSNQQIKQKFGKGLELQIKLKPLLPTDFQFFGDQINRHFGSQLQDIFPGQVEGALSAIGFGHLAREISETGKGASIFNSLQQNGKINSQVLVEWCVLSVAARKVESMLQSRFQTSVIEELQNYIKFEVLGDTKLSEIFGFLEERKHEMFLEDYSVKQMSLEQIFIKFAKVNVHDDN